MAYAKRYGGGFVDKPTLTTPIDSAFLNAVEAALLSLFDANPGAANMVPIWTPAGTHYVPGLITNASIDPAAAIAKSKLAALAIADADVAGAAAIARSKLNFGAGLVDADIAAAAAIVASKLAPLTVNTAPALGTGTVDVAWAQGSVVELYANCATTGAVSLRSWGAPANVGTRLIVRNNSANAITVLHNTAGGTGQRIFTKDGGNCKLMTGDSIEFVYDGTEWLEVSRESRNLTVMTMAGDQNLAQNTLVFINFDVEVIDDKNQHDNVTNNTRITFGEPGWYSVGARVIWQNAGIGDRVSAFRINGASDVAGQANPRDGIFGTGMQNVTYVGFFAAGDYIELWCEHNAGGNINVLSNGNNTRFWAHRITNAG